MVSVSLINQAMFTWRNESPYE